MSNEKGIENAKAKVAAKYGLGSTLVTGHKGAYWEQAMEEYAASRIAELEAENKRLREQQRWIPVTERLPEDYERVLIFDTRNNHINIGYFVPSKFRVPEYNSHWQPLPSKPENK